MAGAAHGRAKPDTIKTAYLTVRLTCTFAYSN
jgi:hypothetical protein